MKSTNSSKKPIVIGILIILIMIVGLLIYQSQRSSDDSDQASNDKEQSQPTGNQEGSSESNSGITRQEAESIATDKYGGTVKETESDDYKGTPAWEVEIRDSERGRIEIKVDKKTGEILEVEND